jgi:hypothetical protein
MDTFIGFLELIGWAVAIIGLAAAVTFVMIKLFPSADEKPANGDAEPSPGS